MPVSTDVSLRGGTREIRAGQCHERRAQASGAVTAEPLRAAIARPSSATGDIGVLVAGGNALSRRAVRTLLSVDARFVVLGEARTRVDLLNLAAQLRPTVVVLDPDLPQGVLPALADLMATHPLPVVVYGDARLANPTAAAELRAAGAVDVVVRDAGLDDLRACLHLASRIRVIRHPRGRLNRTSTLPHVAVPLIVIGASTGGPSAVSAVLSSLPGDLCAAVMVVQHMPAGFLSGLAGWLNGSCRLPVSLGADGDLLRPGEVVVCPGDLDSLVDSVASVLGRRAIGVLLTGMGRDGADGMASLHAVGATTIAQDEYTSAIYGMPRAAIAAGVVDEILPLPEIAAALVRLVAAPERSLR
jgi:two-component system chemotaxis response regulator CheB